MANRVGSLVRRLLGPAAVVIVAAAPASAGAQMQPFVMGGLAVPAGAVKAPSPALPYGDVGLGIQLDAGVAFGMSRGAIDLRVFGTYGAFPREFDAFNESMAENGIDLRLEGNGRIIGGGVGIVYYFPHELTGEVYPYAVASGGLYRQRYTIDYRGDDVAPGTESDVQTDTDVGAAAGLGLIWAPGRVRIFLESRVQMLSAFSDRRGYLIPIQLGLKLTPG